MDGEVDYSAEMLYIFVQFSYILFYLAMKNCELKSIQHPNKLTTSIDPHEGQNHKPFQLPFQPTEGHW